MTRRDFQLIADVLRTNEHFDRKRFPEGLSGRAMTEHEAEQQFAYFLNEVYGTVEVCGMTMDAERVLRECDNTAWREAFNNWVDAESIELGDDQQ